VNFLKKSLTDSWFAFWELLKILVPVIIGVKVGVELGIVDYVGQLLSPIMSIIGLSGEMGIVWATSLLTNIYAGLIALSTISTSGDLTVGQLTIVCTMILIAHSLPLETAVAKKCGVSGTFMAGSRLILAIIAGIILNFCYGGVPQFEEKVALDLGNGFTTDSSLVGWAIGEITKTAAIFFIIWALVIAMEIMKITNAEKVFLIILTPILKPLGITKSSSNLVAAAMLLGISYGGALIIKESKTGNISGKELFSVLTFLTIAHALIEETIITTAVGAHYSGVLLLRVSLAFVYTLIVIKMVEFRNTLTWAKTAAGKG